MTSRETSEYFIPSVPIEMPSATVIVPNSRARAPASCSALRERAETYVARRQVRVGVSDTDDRLVEVLVLESDRTEHRPIGSALHSFRHGTATSFPQCYLSLS